MRKAGHVECGGNKCILFFKDVMGSVSGGVGELSCEGIVWVEEGYSSEHRYYAVITLMNRALLIVACYILSIHVAVMLMGTDPVCQFIVSLFICACQCLKKLLMCSQ
jgi:hypothetical protein